MSPADWDRLEFYSRKVKLFQGLFFDIPQIHPSTYFRIAQLRSSTLFPSLRTLQYNLDESPFSESYIFLFLSPVLDTLELFDIAGSENTIVGPFLATLPSQMLTQIVLHSGRISADIFKKSIVHLKQLRSLELLNAVFIGDFVLWEVLGSLPSLADLTLTTDDPGPESHPAHAPEKSNSQSGGPKYFDALESLSVMGSLPLIHYLLGFIDSLYLNSIEIYPVIQVNHFRNEHEPEDLFTSSMMIIASKWSRSLVNFVICSPSQRTGSAQQGQRYAISRSLMSLTVLQEMQTFHILDWRMKIMNDDVKRLAMSWPKLRSLELPHSQFISLSILRIIAENCPELRHLDILLDTSTIPPFDTSSKSLRHNLEVLTVGNLRAHSSDTTITQTMLECQIKVAQYLDLIFPYLKSIEVEPKDDVTWSVIRDLVKLCQNARQVK